MSKEHDILIIGGGHNGLVSAAYLAEEGLDVLVLERRDIVGGACVTEELIPGFKFSTASMICGLLQPKVIEELQLRDHGLDIYAPDPSNTVVLPGGRHLCAWLDQAKTVAEIEQYSKQDAKAFVEVTRFLQKYQSYITPLWLRNPPTMAEMAARFETPEDQEAFRTIFMGSVDQYANSNFESDAVKVMMTTLAATGHNMSLDNKGNMYKMFWANMAEATGDLGVWGLVRGGMGGITQALARSAKSRGADIRTGAEIDHIRVEDGRAVGVALTTGEELRAKALASNADAKRTFLNLLAPEHLPEDFVGRVEDIPQKGHFAKLFLALDDRPEWDCFQGEDPGTRDNGFMLFVRSLEHIEMTRREATEGRLPEEPWFGLHIQSLTDPSMAPPGQHGATVYVQYAPFDLAEGTWDEVGDDFAKRCIDTLASYSPNLKDILLDYVFFSPRDIESRFYLTEGTMHHGHMFADQMFSHRPLVGWSEYRTPVRNLYLCGSGAHPGGGVTGAPGHNAAQAIIQDWREGVIE